MQRRNLVWPLILLPVAVLLVVALVAALSYARPVQRIAAPEVPVLQSGAVQEAHQEAEEGHEAAPHPEEKAHQERSAGLTKEPTVQFVLQTAFEAGKFGYFGQNGHIAGERNPTLQVSPHDVVALTIVNGDGTEHDFQIPELKVHSGHHRSVGDQVKVVFEVEEPGEYTYYCAIPGHRMLGMEGKVTVAAAPGALHRD